MIRRFWNWATVLCLLEGCSASSPTASIHPDGASPADVQSLGGSPHGTGGSTTGGGGAVASGGVAASGGAVGSGGSGASAGTGGRSGDAGTVRTDAPDAPAAGAGGTTVAGAGGSPATGGRPGTGDAGAGAAIGSGGAGTGGHGGTGGKAGTGGTSSGGGTGSCSTPPDASELVGWAAESGGGVTTTTGGGSASPVTVSTLADLQSAVKGTTAAVIYVKGTLAAGSVSVGSNKTIVGLCGAEIHGHVEVGGSTNVIIRNIKIVGYGVGDCSLDPSYDSSTGCSSGQDAISVQKNAHHIWFDHCDISDGTDGNLDITNAANYVTVSWTKFHYTPRTDDQGDDSTGAEGHRFSNLVGGTDKPSSYDDANNLNVTWHHNWWADNVVERQPRVRFGKNHIFNNLYTAKGDSYCVRAGIDAQILLENNVFSGVKDPHEFNSTSDEDTASITAKNNVYTSSTGTQATGGGGTPFTKPPYDYTLDTTTDLQSAIQAGAGPK